MASTSTQTDERSATAIRFPRELHERLREAALERDHSINFIVVKAVEHYLDRLIPAEQVKLVRD
jgi:predicted DNA-binding protein